MSRDLVHDLDGLAIGMAANSLGRNTVTAAAREIERLQNRFRVLEANARKKAISGTIWLDNDGAHNSLLGYLAETLKPEDAPRA